MLRTDNTPGTVVPPRVTERPPLSSPWRRRRLFIIVVSFHIIAILGPLVWGLVEAWRMPKKENLFRVKIGGNELSHAPIVGKPERTRPGNPAPPPPEPEPEPEPVAQDNSPATPEPTPPPPEPGINFAAVERARKAADAKKKAVADAKRKADAKKKADAERKRKAAVDAKRKADAKKKAAADAKRKAAADARRKAAADAKRRAEAERLRRERESVYSPDRSGPIGAGGTNTNAAVPVGARDTGQEKGKQDNRTPAGGADENDERFQDQVQKFLYAKWIQPPGASLDGKRPEVTIELTVDTNGRVKRAVITKASGVALMDESVKRLLAGLDLFPKPTRRYTNVPFEVVMQTK